MTDPFPDHDPADRPDLEADRPPEAELAAATGRYRIPVLPPVGGAGPVPVRWVRVSDLAAELGGSAVGRGIDLHAELTRRARHLAAASITPAADRVRTPHPARATPPSRSRELPQHGRTL